MTTERPERPAEGALLRDARKARGGMSMEEAARLSGYSVSRWRQIEAGYQTLRAGVYHRVEAPHDTLAVMAEAVGITPAELEAAGRPDAAAHLRKITKVEEIPEPGTRTVTIRHQGSLAKTFVAMTEEASPEDVELAYTIAIQTLRARGVDVPEDPIFPDHDDTPGDRPG